MVNYVQRARDVRHTLRIHGTEEGVRKVLEQLAEDNEMLRQEMQAIVVVTNKMADIVSDIGAVGVQLRNEWERVRQKFHPNNEAGEDIQ